MEHKHPLAAQHEQAGRTPNDTDLGYDPIDLSVGIDPDEGSASFRGKTADATLTVPEELLVTDLEQFA